LGEDISGCIFFWVKTAVLDGVRGTAGCTEKARNARVQAKARGRRKSAETAHFIAYSQILEKDT
jgi:hypothetical protein